MAPRRRNLQLHDFIRVVAALAQITNANRVTQCSLDRVGDRHSAERDFHRPHDLLVAQSETRDFLRVESDFSVRLAAFPLHLNIDGAGRARNITVQSATGAPEFARAAVSALRQWRFSTDAVEARARFSQTFDFALGGGAADGCKYSVGSRICRRVDPDAAVE